MLIRQSFDQRFIDKLKDLENKYSTAMFIADGIGPDKLDINKFARKFFKEKVVADISSDANANVDDDSVLSFEYEFGKALQKLNAYYILWKKMVENPNMGIKRANKILEMCINGTLKVHDQHAILRPYCFAFSLSHLVQKGLPFIKKVKIGPPKHFKSFINLVIQFTAYASNQLAGATAFPDLFIYMDWYARMDYGENYHENDIVITINNNDYTFKESSKIEVMNKETNEISTVTAKQYFNDKMHEKYLIDDKYLQS